MFCSITKMCNQVWIGLLSRSRSPFHYSSHPFSLQYIVQWVFISRQVNDKTVFTSPVKHYSQKQEFVRPGKATPREPKALARTFKPWFEFLPITDFRNKKVRSSVHSIPTGTAIWCLSSYGTSSIRNYRPEAQRKSHVLSRTLSAGRIDRIAGHLSQPRDGSCSEIYEVPQLFRWNHMSPLIEICSRTFKKNCT